MAASLNRAFNTKATKNTKSTKKKALRCGRYFFFVLFASLVLKAVSGYADECP